MTTQRRRTLEDILLGKNRPTRTLEHLLLAKETRKKRDQPETWWQTSTNHIVFTRPEDICHQSDKKPILNRKVISTKNLLVVINNAKNISSYFTSNKHLLVYQIMMRLEYLGKGKRQKCFWGLTPKVLIIMLCGGSSCTQCFIRAAKLCQAGYIRTRGQDLRDGVVL